MDCSELSEVEVDPYRGMVGCGRLGSDLREGRDRSGCVDPPPLYVYSRHFLPEGWGEENVIELLHGGPPRPKGAWPARVAVVSHHIPEVSLRQERGQGTAVGGVIEVPTDGDVLAVLPDRLVDPLHLHSLPPPKFGACFQRAVAFAFQVVPQNDEHGSTGEGDVVLRTIPAEDGRVSPDIRVTPHRANQELAQQPDVNAAGIIPIHEHGVREVQAEFGPEDHLVEAPQGDSVLNLYGAEEVGPNCPDYAARIRDHLGAEVRLFELEPAHPPAAPRDHNLYRLLSLGNLEQMPPHLGQLDWPIALAPIPEPVLVQEFLESLRRRPVVGVASDEIAERGEVRENLAPVFPGGKAHRHGPAEQVLHIEGCEPHGV